MQSEAYRPGERRPIASRDRRIFQLAAQWLADKGVSPNSVSIAGMLSGLAAGAAFAATSFQPEFQRFAWLGGALLVQLRLLANMLDGMVAIAARRASPVGELYNEVPDRVSDAAVLIGLGYALGGNVVLGFAAAGAAILTAYIRAIGKVAGAPQEFCGPMAKPHRMFLVTILGLYGGIAPAAWQAIPIGAGQPIGHSSIVLLLITLGSLATAARRLRRSAASLNRSHP